jgi:hypothetical protein
MMYSIDSSIREWLREGRAWNEQYALRAFLQFNGEFRIKLYTAYLIAAAPRVV